MKRTRCRPSYRSRFSSVCDMKINEKLNGYSFSHFTDTSMFRKGRRKLSIMSQFMLILVPCKSTSLNDILTSVPGEMMTMVNYGHHGF